MTNTAKKVLTLLDAAISPPAPKPTAPPEDPPRRIHPKWHMVTALLKANGLPDKATNGKFETLSLAWKAEMAHLNGYSFKDARSERKRAIADAVAGKGNLKEIPSSQQLLDRNSDIRRVIKERASVSSRAACLIAADVLEKALAHLPEFRKNLIAQQAAIMPELADIKGRSALDRLCDELPNYINLHIKSLRETAHPLTDPAQLLK